MTRQDFVKKYWPVALETGLANNLSPVAILAHALKESGAGNMRAAARHNYFGFLKAGKHVVYPDDRTGFAAYARRMTSTFKKAGDVSTDALAFARAVAHHTNPMYVVTKSQAERDLYTRTLASIHRSVARDVQQLGLQQPMLAGFNVTQVAPTTLMGLGIAIGGILAMNRKGGSYWSSWELPLACGALAYATGKVLNAGATPAAMSGLGAIELSEAPNTPLKRQPIVIQRTDAKGLDFNPHAQPLLNRAALPQLADRVLSL